ncbi:hypothetical protein FOZ62_006093, partial [Perkinsus olseni]
MWRPSVPKFSVARPLGPPEVLTDRLIAEDLEDRFSVVSFTPSADELSLLAQQEALSDASLFAVSSDRGDYHAAHPLSMDAALYFAHQSPLAGPTFRPRTCWWSSFLDPHGWKDYGWIDTVLVDTPLPTDKGEDDWKQHEVRRWREFWDARDAVITDRCLDYLRSGPMLPLCGYAVAGFMPTPERWHEDDLAGRVLLLSGLAVGKSTTFSSDRDYTGHVPAAYEVLSWLLAGGACVQAVCIHTSNHVMVDEEAASCLRHEANVICC